MRILVALAAVVAALTASQSAAGSSATRVAGTWAVTDLGETTCLPGATPTVFNCHVTGFTSQYSGSLSGTSVTSFEETLNCETGRASGKGTETFTGSVAGRGSGSLSWRISFESGFDCTTSSVFNFSAHAVIFTGSGDLVRVRGNIDFTLDDYTGRLTRG